MDVTVRLPPVSVETVFSKVMLPPPAVLNAWSYVPSGLPPGVVLQTLELKVPVVPK
jgi:hypothetical protein